MELFVPATGTAKREPSSRFGYFLLLGSQCEESERIFERALTVPWFRRQTI